MTQAEWGPPMIIDFHTHVFPDHVALRALPALEQEADWKACLDGTLASLLRSMDDAGIDISIIASIATKPTQFKPIFDWSAQIASGRIIPFPSVHPEDPDLIAHLRQIHAAGFKGIKMHPFYQGFELNDPRLFEFYATVEELGLILLSHTGFDIAFPRQRRCDPERIRAVVDRFANLKFVCSHLGAWEDWDEVERLLLGRPIYLDISWSYHWLGRQRTNDFLLRHPADYILFGTDSPWSNQQESLDETRSLDLPPERLAGLLGGNARRLLGL